MENFVLFDFNWNSTPHKKMCDCIERKSFFNKNLSVIDAEGSGEKLNEKWFRVGHEMPFNIFIGNYL